MWRYPCLRLMSLSGMNARLLGSIQYSKLCHERSAWRHGAQQRTPSCKEQLGGAPRSCPGPHSSKPVWWQLTSALGKICCKAVGWQYWWVLREDSHLYFVIQFIFEHLHLKQLTLIISLEPRCGCIIHSVFDKSECKISQDKTTFWGEAGALVVVVHLSCGSAWFAAVKL